MAVGISSSCFYPQEVESGIKKICERKIPVTEVFFNAPSELEKEYLTNLRNMCDEAGVRIKACHPLTSFGEFYYLFSNYKRRFEDYREIYKKYYEACQLLGAEIVILHGDKKTYKITDEEYFERYALMFDDARKMGVKFAQENVVKFRSESPEFIEKMRGFLGDGCAFVLDTKQCRRAEVDIFKMADAMGQNLCHIHFSDACADESCLLPGDGNLDFESIFSYNEATKKADKILEVYSQIYTDENQVFESFNKLKRR